MLLGCIADDLTGASDLANELVARGMRTVQIIGIPKDLHLPDVDAVVISLKSRSIPARDAIDMSLAAMNCLQNAGCKRFYFKYCSTFDSTSAGNIGPVLEALARALNVSGAIACPAFPATGRTVYQGYLFVGDKLLNESGMERHPITPMTDANLIRVLQAQMNGEVAHLGLSHIVEKRVGAQMAAFVARGVGAVIADAVTQSDLDSLGHYCAWVPLSSGGSGLGAGIASAIVGAAAPRSSAPLPPTSGWRAIVAGSCSNATQRQVAHARQHYPSLRIALEAGQTVEGTVNNARRWIDAQSRETPILVYSTASPSEVAAQRDVWGDHASAALEEILAELANHFLDEGVDALLVAGGETSGAVVQRLGCGTLAIGPEIDPGVPWLVAERRDGAPMALALKSGNFGSDDFMTKAWSHLT